MSVSIQLSTQGPLALSADVLVIAVSPGPVAKQEPLKSLDGALSGGSPSSSSGQMTSHR